MKLVFDFDPDKCTACGACAIACMDQNDIDMDAGQRPYRRIAQVESQTELVYLSAACLHCPDAPVSPPAPKPACIRTTTPGWWNMTTPGAWAATPASGPVPMGPSPSGPPAVSAPGKDGEVQRLPDPDSGGRRPRLRPGLSHRRPDLALGGGGPLALPLTRLLGRWKV